MTAERGPSLTLTRPDPPAQPEAPTESWWVAAARESREEFARRAERERERMRPKQSIVGDKAPLYGG